MIGRTDKLEMRRGLNHPKARRIDLSRVLYRPGVAPGTATYQCETQDHRLDRALDHKLIAKAKPALERAEAGHHRAADPQRQSHRRRHALRRDRQALWRRGPARWHDPCALHRHRRAELRRFPGARRHARARRRHQRLCGKGLSGGRIVVYPPHDSTLEREKSIIVGNTVLYGAIERRMLSSAASPASASPCATRALSPSSRASARMAANT